ncbi:uncharacterized protein LOC132605012 [Lycium barbarum]|uniref:uncharacterized protein LOC132605012 n=1 Tax=Lycium barbarum TaxID=112863 RepID=UPI00293ED47C|nr:uncharacterized protein LOC132605012 [Lycium barbarum]
MPCVQSDEFGTLNSYLREIKLGNRSIKGELNTFVWTGTKGKWQEHFFQIMKDMYPELTRELFKKMYFLERTWDDFRQEIGMIYRLDNEWKDCDYEDTNFYTTLEDKLNKVVKAQISEIYSLESDENIILDDDAICKTVYFFYNTELKRLVCLKIAEFNIEEPPVINDDEEEDVDGNDNT